MDKKTGNSGLQTIINQIGQRRTVEMRHSLVEAKLSSKRDWYDYL